MLRTSLTDEYRVFRECFFAQCFRACLDEFIVTDGLDFLFTIGGKSRESPYLPTRDITHWIDLNENSTDSIYIHIAENKEPDKTIHTFDYKIADFMDDYDCNAPTFCIFHVFKRMAEAFQKDYIKWFMRERARMDREELKNEHYDHD